MVASAVGEFVRQRLARNELATMLEWFTSHDDKQEFT
jgi:hypothetical protein